jgi:regulator of RNase E activity RraA
LTAADYVACDDDGIIFLPRDRLDEIAAIGARIAAKERSEADRMRAGTSLREQTRFAEYLARREANPSYTFREHLKSVVGAIEE